MRTYIIAGCLLLLAASLNAQIVTSLDPPSFKENSGEWFLTANGRYLGDTFVYDGPAGTFKIDANSVTTYASTAWVPLEILRTPGVYKLMIDGPNGASDPVSFEVIPTSKLRIPLTLVLPEVLTAAARTTKGAYVKYEVQTFGGDDPEPIITCEPASGSFFYTGTNRVGCTATNRYDEKTSDTFSISVIDGPPIISVPADIYVLPESERGTYVKYDVTAYDEVDGVQVAVKCSPESGSLFPLGVTSVACSAADSMGNPETAMFLVNVTYEKQP